MVIRKRVMKLLKEDGKQLVETSMLSIRDVTNVEANFEPVNYDEAKVATEELNAQVERDEYESSPMGHLAEAGKSTLSAGWSFFNVVVSGSKFLAYTTGATFQFMKGGMDSIYADNSWAKEAANNGYDALKHSAATMGNAADAILEAGIGSGKAIAPYVASAAEYAMETIGTSIGDALAPAQEAPADVELSTFATSGDESVLADLLNTQNEYGSMFEQAVKLAGLLESPFDSDSEDL